MHATAVSPRDRLVGAIHAPNLPPSSPFFPPNPMSTLDHSVATPPSDTGPEGPFSAPAIGKLPTRKLPSPESWALTEIWPPPGKGLPAQTADVLDRPRRSLCCVCLNPLLTRKVASVIAVSGVFAAVVCLSWWWQHGTSDRRPA